MKVRMCGQCGARNSVDAWNCAKCGNTLSINSVLDVSDNPLPEETDKNFVPNQDPLPNTSVLNEILGESDQAKVPGLYCSTCGQKLNTDDNFCSRCGAKIQNGTMTHRGIPNEYQDEKYEQTPIVCPKCLLHDKIEKVMSIVKSQTRTREQTEWVTEYYTDKNGKEQSYSYPRSYDVVEITDLAKLLSPPQKPQAKGFSGFLIILGILLLINVVFTLLTADDIGNMICLATYVIPLIIIYLAKTNHDNKEQARVAMEMPLWENAIKIWNRLYYCHRDHILRDAEDIKNVCQPEDREDIIKFCYQQK
jgi:ribosomal protein L40E